MKFSKKYLLALASFASISTSSAITMAADRAAAAAPIPAINVQPRPGPHCTRTRCYQTYTACVASNSGPCTPQGPRSPLFGVTEWSWGSARFDTLAGCLNSDAAAECSPRSGTIVVPPEYLIAPSNERRRADGDVSVISAEKWACIYNNHVFNGKCGGLTKGGNNAWIYQ
jgi:hypothetical protein